MTSDTITKFSQLFSATKTNLKFYSIYLSIYLLFHPLLFMLFEQIITKEDLENIVKVVYHWSIFKQWCRFRITEVIEIKLIIKSSTICKEKFNSLTSSIQNWFLSWAFHTSKYFYKRITGDRDHFPQVDLWSISCQITLIERKNTWTSYISARALLQLNPQQFVRQNDRRLTPGKNKQRINKRKNKTEKEYLYMLWKISKQWKTHSESYERHQD